MKMFYIANARMPTEKAHGLQIMKMCEAFAALGIQVELVLPRRFNPIKTDPFEYYKIQRNFKITRVFSLDLVGKIQKLGFWIQSLTFAKRVYWYCLWHPAGFIYSRDAFSLYALSFWRKNLVWEAHVGENLFLIRRLLKECKKIVAITHGVKDFYVNMGADPNKFVIAPDGVQLKDFVRAGREDSKSKARKELGLPLDKNLIVYTGHLYGWKGANVLAEAAHYLGDDDCVVFVGGTGQDLKNFRKIFSQEKRVLTFGHKPHEQIPAYLQAADILVLPNSGKTEISRVFTSPLKLFEYMAAGRPIVAADLPSIREILDESLAIFFTPDDPEDLARKIESTLRDQVFSAKISQKAKERVASYTWEKRAQKILEFLQK